MLKPIDMPITSEVYGPVAKPFDGSGYDNMGNSLGPTVQFLASTTNTGNYINSTLFLASTSTIPSRVDFQLDGDTFTFQAGSFVHSSGTGPYTFFEMNCSTTGTAFGNALPSSSQATTLGLRIDINGDVRDYYPGDVPGYPAWTLGGTVDKARLVIQPTSSWSHYPNWGTPAMSGQVLPITFSWLNLV